MKLWSAALDFIQAVVKNMVPLGFLRAVNVPIPVMVVVLLLLCSRSDFSGFEVWVVALGLCDWTVFSDEDDRCVGSLSLVAIGLSLVSTGWKMVLTREILPLLIFGPLSSPRVVTVFLLLATERYQSTLMEGVAKSFVALASAMVLDQATCIQLVMDYRYSKVMEIDSVGVDISSYYLEPTIPTQSELISASVDRWIRGAVSVDGSAPFMEQMVGVDGDANIGQVLYPFCMHTLVLNINEMGEHKLKFSKIYCGDFGFHWNWQILQWFIHDPGGCSACDVVCSYSGYFQEFVHIISQSGLVFMFLSVSVLGVMRRIAPWFMMQATSPVSPVASLGSLAISVKSVSLESSFASLVASFTRDAMFRTATTSQVVLLIRPSSLVTGFLDLGLFTCVTNQVCNLLFLSSM